MTRRGDCLRPEERPALTGTEVFLGGPDVGLAGATVSDFWALAMSELCMNNGLSYLAEFIVARALSVTHRRVVWDDVEVPAPAGVRVEIKAASQLEAGGSGNCQECCSSAYVADTGTTARALRRAHLQR